MNKDGDISNFQKLHEDANKPSNFQLVLKFQEAMGNLSGPFDPVKILKETMAQVTSEYEELRDEVDIILSLADQIPVPANFQYHNLRKELADLGVVLLQMAARMGFDYDSDFAEVHDNNLSKLITTQDQMVATLAMYQNLNVDTFVCYTNLDGQAKAIVKSKADQVGADGKFYPANKGLKPAGFQIVSLSPLPSREPSGESKPNDAIPGMNIMGTLEGFKDLDQQ